MNKFLALTRVVLKNGGGNFTSKNKFKSFALIALLIIAFIPLSISIGAFAYTTYDTLAAIQQQGIIIASGVAISAFIILFFGIFYVLNTFYFSLDIENLLPMPLKPSQILSAKFTTVVLYEYLTELVILLPIIISYGVKSSASVLYYFNAIIIFLILPITPLVIASLINMIIMRFTNLGKNKDKFRLISGLIAMAAGLGINLYIQKMSRNAGGEQEIISLLQSGNNSLTKLASKIFPGSNFATEALISSTSADKGINLLIFVLITVIAYIVFLIISEKLYFKGVIGISEGTSSRKVLSESQFSKNTAQKSVVKAYTSKEMKILFRTPIYFMNCILLNFIWPVFLLIPIITEPEMFSQLRSMNIFLENPEIGSIILLVASMTIIFISSTNAITSTAISREGKNIFVNKFIPVDYKNQILSKVLTGIIMGTVATIMTVILLLFLISPPVYLILLILLIAAPLIIFSSQIGILIDLYRPKLNWDTEQKAVKQNLNVVLHLLGSIVISGLLCFFLYTMELNVFAIFIALIVFYTVVDFILYKILTITGVKLYKNIEG